MIIYHFYFSFKILIKKLFSLLSDFEYYCLMKNSKKFAFIPLFGLSVFALTIAIAPSFTDKSVETEG